MLPYVFLTLPSRDAWPGLWKREGDDQGDHGAAAQPSQEVFIPGNTHVLVGDTVHVEVRFLREDFLTTLRAVVQARYPAPRTDARPPGVGVVFPPSESCSLRMLDALASGRHTRPLERGDRRFPVSLPMDYAAWDDLKGNPFTRALTRNISRSGAFLRTDDAPNVGTVLNLRFKVPQRYDTLSMRGLVMWRRVDGPGGVGVRFIFDRPSARAALQRFVGRLEGMVERARVSSDASDRGGGTWLQ